MRINILNFIQEHAIFHSDMLYDESRKSFDMSSYKNNHPGIYFILDGDDLLEIDKLKNQIASFQKNHDLLMSVSPSYFFESDQPQDFYTSKQKEKNTIQFM